MTDQKPLSPFTLTPPRIMILVLGALALVLIIGSMAGVGNYQALREAASASSSAPSSSAP